MLRKVHVKGICLSVYKFSIEKGLQCMTKDLAPIKEDVKRPLIAISDFGTIAICSETKGRK